MAISSADSMTAEDIINSTPDIREKFIVEGILPVGLTILGAGTKMGKSILSTQLAIAVAEGRSFLERTPSTTSSVVYISLEEGPDSLRDRLDKAGCSVKNLVFKFKWRLANMGGIALLSSFLRSNHECKLVIIDILEKFKGVGGRGGYKNDYRELAPLKDVATKHGVSILILHHTTKALTKDWVTSLYGSNGVTGVCDGIWFLDRVRGSDDAVLRITGRGVPDSAFELKLNREKLSWDFISEEPRQSVSAERVEILLILGQSNGVMRLAEIAKFSKKSRSNAANLLKKMVSAGLVRKPVYGMYSLTGEGTKCLIAMDQ